MAEPGRRLLVLGTGFGATQVLRRLAGGPYDATVVSPRNYFLFTPLLVSTTVGTIDFRSIIEPIRSFPGVTYYRARATDIDTGARTVTCRQDSDGHAFVLGYDVLVVAVGATVNTFGVPGVREHCLFLRDLPHARDIRRAIIDRLEQASAPDVDADRRDRLLRFVIIGGGPTGVELAAEIHDLVDEDLPRWFGNTASRVRIVLLEGLDRILGSFDARLQEFARRRFARQDIEVRTRARVVEVTEEDVVLADGDRIPYGLVFWSGGIAQTPLVESLPWPKAAGGGLLVDGWLRVPGEEDVFALGDCAVLEGQPLPATAQVAQQQGKYLGRALARLARGREPQPFRFRSLGMLAYVGDRRALADLPRFKGRGWLTWLFWRSVYLTRLVSARNKFLVVVDWLKTLLFGRDFSEL